MCQFLQTNNARMHMSLHYVLPLAALFLWLSPKANNKGDIKPF